MVRSARSAREVLSETDQIVAQDRKLTLRLLKNLHEIERNKFYLELGFGSMFQYCTAHLRYSEPAALRRMRAARCLGVAPQLHDLLESGDVNTTTLAMIAKYMKPDNANAMIGAIKGKSKRAVERYVAGLEPKAAFPPDRVRCLVVPTAVAAVPQPAAEREVTVAGDGKESSSAGELTTSADVDAKLDVPQFTHMARVEFTAHEELIEKLDRIRSLVSHRLRGGASLEELITFMADYVIEREDPIKRHERRTERVVKKNDAARPSMSANARQIPAAVRDRVFARDQRCTYVSPDGKRCNSTHVLQVDHIKPVARRGAATIDNLRLLCAYHNRLESERLMGKRDPRDVVREAPVAYVALGPGHATQ